jgi:hypothetical protein
MMELQAHKASKETLDLKDQLATMVLLELKAFREILVHRV